MSRYRSPLLPLPLSLILGLLLSVLPLPELLQPWRPEWLTLVLLFWVMHAPLLVGIWTAVFLGFLLDILLATPLGLYASSLAVLVYLARMTQRWSGVFSIRQTSALVFLLVLVSRGIRFIVLNILGQDPGSVDFFLPAIASALIWPTILLSLRRWTQRA